MIVICEECGKKYDIDAARIKGLEARAKCKACGHIIIITRKETKPAAPSPPLRAEESLPKSSEPEGMASEPNEMEKASDTRTGQLTPPRRKGFGLRPKIFVLFFFIPIALMVSSRFLD